MREFKEPKNKTFPKMEDRIIKFWKKNKIFEKSVEQRPKNNLYVFVDGPPFVTGDPHYGSLLPSIAKDVIPRYWTMKGKRVRRIFGWDCHGLPIEEKINKKFGIKNRTQVEEKFGVERYVKECKKFVEASVTNWRWYVDRVGRWVDMDNAYYTMHTNFNESVIWAFKKIHELGLIYKGKRVSLFSTDTSTPVSGFEVAMDPDNYRDVEDVSVFVKFKVKILDSLLIKGKKMAPVYLVAWTTTPWTLPSNFALAIHPSYKYVLVKYEDEFYILAKDRMDYAFGKKNDVVVLKEFKGAELEGIEYVPLYDFFVSQSTSNDFKVYLSRQVESDEGTGILHVAPAFGEVDHELGKLFELSDESSIDEEGIMLVGQWKGEYLRDASSLIADDLEKNGCLLKKEMYTHRLPFYRGDNPLIYKAQDSYFINLKDVNKRILELNKKVNWIPAHFKTGRFAKTVEQAPDWCISRNRYWATIMPIWRSEDGDQMVIGSIEELRKYTDQIQKKTKKGKTVYYMDGEEFRLHRDMCDKIVLKKNGRVYHRIPEVLDVWLDSGSVPFAEYHYPFENKKVFDRAFPADYIIEYTGQIRAWFQMLFRVSTMIFDDIPFKNVLVTGVIGGTDGRKMSKSFKNYPDPRKVLEEIGGDALRLYFMSSPIMLGENANFDNDELRNKSRNVLNPLWNTAKYFLIYAKLNKWDVSKQAKSNHVLDRWVVARLHQTIKEFSENIEKYNIPYAVRPVEAFVNDLSNWYLRRSRDRISSGDKKAISTLYKVLVEFSKAAAPIMPFITENIYQLLVVDVDKKAVESVHLCEYPKHNTRLISSNKSLLEDMEKVRKIASLANAVRKEINIPVRQPLSEMKVVGIQELSYELVELIKDELNIKKVSFVNEVPSSDGWCSNEDGDVSVALNTALTEDLRIEGYARELMREIQKLRKQANVKWHERIKVQYKDDDRYNKAIEHYEEEIKSKTLVTTLQKGSEFKIQ